MTCSGGATSGTGLQQAKNRSACVCGIRAKLIQDLGYLLKAELQEELDEAMVIVREAMAAFPPDRQQAAKDVVAEVRENHRKAEASLATVLRLLPGLGGGGDYGYALFIACEICMMAARSPSLDTEQEVLKCKDLSTEGILGRREAVADVLKGEQYLGRGLNGETTEMLRLFTWRRAQAESVAIEA